MVTRTADETKDEETYQQKFLAVAKNKDSLEMSRSLTYFKLLVRNPSDSKSDFEEFPGLLHRKTKDFDEYLAGVVNKMTKKQLPEAYIKNRVRLLMKQMLKDFYDPDYVCTDMPCSTHSNAYDNCRHTYKKVKVDEKGVANTFNYLEKIFDTSITPKYDAAEKVLTEQALEPYKHVYNEVKNKIKLIRKNNAYDEVKLENVFSFMTCFEEKEEAS